jgi:Cft2 family RNA processing exonuclease
VLLTHAHADHVKLSKSSNFFATPETIDLVNERKKIKYSPKFSSLPFNKPQKFDNFSLTLKPNGHLLGSSLVEINSETTTTITSDFRLQDSLLFKGAVPKETDNLVLETTFGSPQYSFPSNKEVVNNITNFIETNASEKLVILGGYSLGKAQELTKISNLAGFIPLVHKSIFNLNEIYSNHNIPLGKYKLLDHNLKDFNVLILPPHLVDRFLFSTIKHFDSREIISAVATGWPQARGFDYTFPLSNHADYNDLISFVEQSNPKLVLTDHGFCSEFSRKLTRLGYNSKPLKQHKQKGLFEF